jgi:hypothetical protein
MKKTPTLEAGLVGWRDRLARKIDKPVAKRTPLKAKQVRAVLGALFFLKSTIYLVRSLRLAMKR